MSKIMHTSATPYLVEKRGGGKKAGFFFSVSEAANTVKGQIGRLAGAPMDLYNNCPCTFVSQIIKCLISSFHSGRGYIESLAADCPNAILE